MIIGSPLKGIEGMYTAVFYHWTNTDDVLCYLRYLMFDLLHLLLFSCNLSSKSEERSELLQSVPEPGQLSQVFQNQPNSVIAVVKDTGPSPPRRSDIGMDSDEMPVDQPQQQAPAVALIYVNHSILHSDATWRSVRRPTLATTLIGPDNHACLRWLRVLCTTANGH